MNFLCPICATPEATPLDGAEPVFDPTAEIARCDTCKTILAYGTPMPRIVIEPASDDRFVLMRVSGAIHILEKSFARALGHNLTSIT